MCRQSQMLAAAGIIVRVLAAFLIVAATASTSAAGNDQWIRVESPHFVVFGEIGEKRTREYAADFERFREALARVVAGAAARPAAPTVVFIFKDGRSFDPYRPLYKGKPVQVSGYFVGGSSLDAIMLPATDREAALHTIYHEYSHLITSNGAWRLPVWLSEGLAEYYSTFEVQAEGRKAVLGRVIDRHLARLNEEPFISLDQLLGVEHESPLYNEGSRRSTFYAQSWALVHMLLNGQANRTRQFHEYVRLTASGQSARDAWQQVFKDQKILEDLRRYVRHSTMKEFVFTFERAIAPATFSVSSPAPADIHAALGDLRLQVAPETAAEHMTRSPGADTAFTAAVRGLVELEESRNAVALPLLLRAARESKDWLVQYRAATGLERIATGPPSDVSRSAAETADAALQQVLMARPDLAHAVALRAMIIGPGDAGLALIKEARRLAPGRAHYAIWQAQHHVVRGEFSEAQALLAPLRSAWYPQETRDYAGAVMSEAAAAEQARAVTKAATHRTEAARKAPPGIVVTLFRELRTGEQRVEATFERIECPRDGVILHVRIGERRARFTASALEALELLTYRDDPAGPVGCGSRDPLDRIYLTWRPAAGDASVDGIAIAIEFLPR
jgi:hypothetical protein